MKKIIFPGTVTGRLEEINLRDGYARIYGDEKDRYLGGYVEVTFHDGDRWRGWRL